MWLYSDRPMSWIFFSFDFKTTFLLASVVLNIKMFFRPQITFFFFVSANAVIIHMVKILLIFLFHNSFFTRSILTTLCLSGADRLGQASKKNNVAQGWARSYRPYCQVSSFAFWWYLINPDEQYEEKTMPVCPKWQMPSITGWAGFLLVSIGLWTQWKVMCEGCCPAP